MRSGEPLSPDEIARRAPLWVALSDLFLDTEMQAVHYQGIVDAARDGGFAPDEVITILNEEVAPVLNFNLLQVAGEWAMFDPDWVVARVSARLAYGSRRRPILPRRWPVLEKVLRGEDVEEAVIAGRSRTRPLWWFFWGAVFAVAVWRLLT